MFCRNCGANGVKGKFCRYCGAPIIAPPVTGQTPQTTGQTPQANHPQFGNPNVPNVGANSCNMPYNPAPRPARRKKKSHAGAIIAAVMAALLVMVGGGILLGGKIVRMASPAKYYQSVEKENLATWIAHAENFAELTGDDGANTTLSLSITDDGKKLMGDTDTSWLRTVSLDVSSAKDEVWSYLDGTLNINDSRIIDFESLEALSGDGTILRLPDFSDLYIELPQNSGYMDVVNLFGATPVDMDALSAVLDRYGEIVIENFDKVEKQKETVTVGSTTAEYDAFVVTIDSETSANISREIAEEARSDRDMERLIRSVAESEGEDPDAAYAEFLQDLDEAASFDETEENTLVATMTVYVNKKGEICGRRYVSAETPDTVNYYITAWDGKNFETEVSLTEDDGVFRLTGSGLRDGNIISGDFTAFSGDIQLWTMRVDEFDKKAYKDGKIDANVTVTPAKDYIDESGESPLMATMGYQIDITSASGKLDATVSLWSDASNLGTLQVSSKKKNVSIPSVSDGEKTDYETYLNSIDQEQAEEKLKNALRNAGVPEEYIN